MIYEEIDVKGLITETRQRKSFRPTYYEVFFQSPFSRNNILKRYLQTILKILKENAD